MSVFSASSRFASFVYDHFRIIHALKLGIALFIAASINYFFKLPHFIWSMVTIVIIMMSLPQVGGAIEKSLQRAVGTTLGAAYGVLLIALFHEYWAVMGFLIIGVMSISYICSGRYSYAYLVAGFTMIIVIGDANHDTSEAIWRTTNILLGCVIAMVVSLLVLPIKAKQDWRSQFSNAIGMMSNLLALHIQAKPEYVQENQKALEKVMKAVLDQKKLFFSLEWESTTLKRHKIELEKLVQAQVRMVTLLELLLQTKWQEHEDAAFDKVNQQAQLLVGYLDELINFANGKADNLPPIPDDFDQQLYQALQQQLNLEQTEHFALSGYAWLVYQLSRTILNIYTQVRLIEQAYIDKPKLLQIHKKNS
ncbi:FUSC family protein [Shewanella marina]|uniref:FUSC family protein n=1 Tax=Shewanella marina TaxID=487319 RepID=UPI00046F92C4|nr:FUSC family protein [Shewanella marina]